MTDPAALRARLASVRDRIARAADRAGRDPSSIRLIAISKTFGADDVRAAADCGQVDFGENRVQEALEKMERTADLALRWHLVGHLQSNKAKKAGARFHVLHSVDHPEVASRLDAGAAAAGRHIDWLVQVDLAGEPTKHGVEVAQLPGIVKTASTLGAARLVGLMVLPPAVDDPEQARPFFRTLRGLRDDLLAGGVNGTMLAHLSMGMSHDFEVAVEEGATLVRVGTAIFGDRTYQGDSSDPGNPG
jgi:pyridoxal phosphate enzyme (YggS family)